jgi:hypothetical protein
MSADTDWFGAEKGAKHIEPEIEQRAVQVSDDAGFTLRQPLKDPPKRRRGTKAQLHNFTLRLDIDDATKFIRWCERERLAYREGFARLVGHIAEGQ